VPPVDSLQDIFRRRFVSRWSRWVWKFSKLHHHEVANAGQCVEIGNPVRVAGKSARIGWQVLKFNAVHKHRPTPTEKTATFIAEAIVGGNGSGMQFHQVGLEGRQEPFRRRGLTAGLSGIWRCTTFASDQHAKGSNAITKFPAPTRNKEVVLQGFERRLPCLSARNAPPRFAFPYVCRIRKGPAASKALFRIRTNQTPTRRFSGDAMAGLGRGGGGGRAEQDPIRRSDGQESVRSER